MKSLTENGICSPKIFLSLSKNYFIGMVYHLYEWLGAAAINQINNYHHFFKVTWYTGFTPYNKDKHVN